MRWDKMLAAELVVVAKYEKHEGKSLSLRVDSVLKGKNVKPGDVITVALAGKYSVEDKLRLWGEVGPEQPGGPWLCYLKQIMNPGDLVPVNIIPDIRQPEVYFLPSETAPELSMPGQVQAAVLADGWRQAVQGKPMDLLFRLVQQVNPHLHDEAMEELAWTRDPKVLSALIGWAIDPPPEGTWQHGACMMIPAEGILEAVGDHEGDVYGPLWKWLTDPKGRRGTDGAYERIPKILGAIAPDRAFRDFSKKVTAGKAGADGAIWWLGYVRTEQSLRFLLKVLKGPPPSMWATRALAILIPHYADGGCSTSATLAQR